MSFWDEIRKVADKAEQIHGTATKVLSGDSVFDPVGIPATTTDVIAPAPAVEIQQSSMAKVSEWWRELPAPAKYGVYGFGSLALAGIAWKLFK